MTFFSLTGLRTSRSIDTARADTHRREEVHLHGLRSRILQVRPSRQTHPPARQQSERDRQPAAAAAADDKRIGRPAAATTTATGSEQYFKQHLQQHLSYDEQQHRCRRRRRGQPAATAAAVARNDPVALHADASKKPATFFVSLTLETFFVKPSKTLKADRQRLREPSNSVTRRLKKSRYFCLRNSLITIHNLCSSNSCKSIPDRIFRFKIKTHLFEVV